MPLRDNEKGDDKGSGARRGGEKVNGHEKSSHSHNTFLQRRRGWRKPLCSSSAAPRLAASCGRHQQQSSAAAAGTNTPARHRSAYLAGAGSILMSICASIDLTNSIASCTVGLTAMSSQTHVGRPSAAQTTRAPACVVVFWMCACGRGGGLFEGVHFGTAFSSLSAPPPFGTTRDPKRRCRLRRAPQNHPPHTLTYTHTTHNAPTCTSGRA